MKTAYGVKCRTKVERRVTTKQQVRLPIQASTDANGNVTFVFPQIALSQTWVGTLSCPTALYTSAFSAFAGADELGSWIADNTYGPIYLEGGTVLQVTATGLFPSTQYGLRPYTLYFTGFVITEGETPIVFPTAYADTVNATNQGGVTFKAVTLSYPGPFPYLLGYPTLGYSYRLHSVAFYWQFSGITNMSSVLVTGAALGSNYNFFVKQVAPPASQSGILPFGGDTVMLNGLLIPDSIGFGFTPDAGGNPLSINIALQYDVVRV